MAQKGPYFADEIARWEEEGGAVNPNLPRLPKVLRMSPRHPGQIVRVARSRSGSGIAIGKAPGKPDNPESEMGADGCPNSD